MVDSIGVSLFRMDLEKLVRLGVRMPAEDGMIAASLGLGVRTGSNNSKLGLTKF